jgi:hypothetical protein
MVSAVVTAVPLGVTLAGLKVQVAPVGKPVQAKVTCLLKPPTGVKREGSLHRLSRRDCAARGRRGDGEAGRHSLDGDGDCGRGRSRKSDIACTNGGDGMHPGGQVAGAVAGCAAGEGAGAEGGGAIHERDCSRGRAGGRCYGCGKADAGSGVDRALADAVRTVVVATTGVAATVTVVAAEVLAAKVELPP